MAKKVVIELTEIEFNSLLDILDDVSGMQGTGDDALRGSNLKKVDKALKRNGYKRKFN